jgi:hypothetical protein
VHVDGTTATLARGDVRLCIGRVSGKPSCSSRVKILSLSWTRHGHFYRVSGLGEHRAHVIGFARSLVPVK